MALLTLKHAAYSRGYWSTSLPLIRRSARLRASQGCMVSLDKSSTSGSNRHSIMLEHQPAPVCAV